MYGTVCFFLLLYQGLNALHVDGPIS
jgi:hypothetical protein